MVRGKTNSVRHMCEPAVGLAGPFHSLICPNLARTGGRMHAEEPKSPKYGPSGQCQQRPSPIGIPSLQYMRQLYPA